MEAKTKNILIGAGIATGAVLLFRYFMKQFNYLYNASYYMTGVVIHKISLTEVKLTIIMKIVNKSDIELTIENQNYEVFFNNILVSKISRTKPNIVQARATSSFPLEVSFNPKTLVQAGASNLMDILTDKSKIKITTKGYVDVRSGILYIKQFPFEYTTTLKELTETTPDKKLEPPKEKN